MAKKSTSSMRIGPISVITLISILMLAVLTLLCLATTRANYTMAQRQSAATTQAYVLDACAQDIVSEIDDELQSAGSATAAASAISENAASVAQAAIALLETQGIDAGDLTAEVQVQGTQIAINVAQAGERELNAIVTLNDNLTYTINSWKTSTIWQSEDQTLWSGSSTGQ